MALLRQVILAVSLITLACSNGGSDTSPLSTPSVPASSPAANPTAAANQATARPVVVTQAMLASIVINAQEVGGLYGSTTFNQSRTNVTDIPTAFSSSPELGQFLTSQNVAGVYNAWTATAQCLVCAVQVPFMIFPAESAASAAYDRIRQVNQSIFQNVASVNGFSSYWNASFCQTGTFTSGTQTLNWLFCAARKGNTVFTAAVGGFNFNAQTVGDAIRAYAMRVENYLKTQFP
jgi:hypothetical protein